MTFNLFLRSINDCIRESDGERLIEYYKCALIYLKAFGHSKYALAVLSFFFDIKMKPDLAFRLI